MTGWPATARASSGCPARVSQAAEPSPWGRSRAGSSAGSALSTSWSSAAASTSRRSTATPARLDPGGEPGGHLGHGARVSNEPGGRIQGEQEGGGLHPPRYRHRLDGTRRRGRDRGASATRAGGGGSGAGSSSGTRAVTGMAQRYAAARAAAPVETRGRRRGRSPAFRTHGHPGGFEPHDDGPVTVGPEDASTGCGQPVQRGPGRMTVWVAGPGRGHGDARLGPCRRMAASWRSCCRDGRP